METNTPTPLITKSNNPIDWIQNWQYYATIHKDHTVAYFAFCKEKLAKLYENSPLLNIRLAHLFFHL